MPRIGLPAEFPIGEAPANDGVDIGDVDVKTINDVAPQFDDTNKLAVSLYGKWSTAADQILRMQPSNVDGIAGLRDLAVVALPFSWDGEYWNRLRGNTEHTLLTSAARTATTSSADQVNYNARGVMIFFSITAVPGTDTVRVAVEGKDPVADTYVKLLSAYTEAAIATRCYVIYPGGGASGDGIEKLQPFPLPRTWRVTVTHSGSGSFTYSVGAALIL